MITIERMVVPKRSGIAKTPIQITVWVALFCSLLSARLVRAQESTAPKSHSENQANSGQNASADSEYRVGTGDVLGISVWKEPEASVPSLVVRPDGKITLPLIEELSVNGKTPLEIQRAIEEKLSPYIKLPSVSVTVIEIRSKKVYVVGQVVHQGSFSLRQPTTVLQILTEAGGLQPFAKEKAIYILRKQAGKPVRLPFNYKDVVRGKKIEQNVQLEPDDTVVVP
jgi:polysaccharide export outer membrane protein